jgi:hypothetical protein
MRMERHHRTGTVNGRYLDPESTSLITVDEHLYESRILASCHVGEDIDASTWLWEMEVRLMRTAVHLSVTLAHIEDPSRMIAMCRDIGDDFHRWADEGESELECRE